VRAGSRRLLRLIGLIAVTCALPMSAAELRVGQATTLPGTVVSVPVMVAGASDAVAAQFDVHFSGAVVSLTDVAAGDGLAGRVVDQQELSPGHWRVLVYSPTHAPITTGAMVWLSFAMPPATPDGIVPLGLTNAIVARVAGQRVQPLAQADGALMVWAGGSFRSMTLESDGRLQMQFQGAVDRAYAFEVSTNLTDWLALTTNTMEGGLLNLTVTNTSIYPQQFYRARLLP
jgi:hypothetical protein